MNKPTLSIKDLLKIKSQLDEHRPRRVEIWLSDYLPIDEIFKLDVRITGIHPFITNSEEVIIMHTKAFEQVESDINLFAHPVYKKGRRYFSNKEYEKRRFGD